MICGVCKNGGVDIDHVKRCSQGATPMDHQQGALWGWNDSRPMRPVKPTEERREERRGNLIEQVNKIGAAVPVGRYALRNQGHAANNIQFVHVERPDKGRYQGKTFVKRQLGPALERIPMAEQRALLLRIAADPQGASQLYGRELGVCGVCGIHLTNEESRAYGIGPVCRKNMGY